MYIKQEDLELPTYHFDPQINPISAYKLEENEQRILSQLNPISQEELDEFLFDQDFQAILSDIPLENKKTAPSIALLWAGKPFN